jgi:hypothetical protein
MRSACPRGLPPMLRDDLIACQSIVRPEMVGLSAYC